MAKDTADKVIIDIVLDDGSVKQVFNRIEKNAKDAGKEAGPGISIPMTKAFDVVAKAAAIAGTAIAGALFVGTRAAMVQEDAVLSMNQALANAGRYSEEASKEFQTLATEIQRTTRVGDEQSIAILAMASNYARTNEEAKKLAMASIDLAAAMNMDVNGAILNLGKTFSGLMGELGESIPEIRNLTQAQLEAGAAVDLILNKFGGTAASQANNFKGIWTQMANAFGDVTEEVGYFVTKSPVMVELLRIIRESFESMGDAMSGMREGRDILGEMVISTISFAEGVNKYLIMPLEVASQIGATYLNALLTAVQGYIAGVVNGLNWLVQKLPSFGGRLDGIKDTLAIAAESTKEVFQDQMKETADSFDNILNVDMALSIDKFLAVYKERLKTVRALTQNFRNNDLGTAMQAPMNADQLFPGFSGMVGQMSMGFNTLGTAIDAIKEKYKDNADAMAEAMQKLSDKTKESMRQAGQALFQGLGAGAGQAFAAFGKAIATGQDAMQAFLDSLLATIGQSSIQLGTNFILQGAAYSLAGLPNGPALMAAGAALATFGGVLSGISGGQATAPQPGTPGGPPIQTEPAGGDTSTSPDISESIERREPQTQVVLNIQGDVLDSEESGLRIVKIFNDAFDKQGVVVKRGVMA